MCNLGVLTQTCRLIMITKINKTKKWNNLAVPNWNCVSVFVTNSVVMSPS